MVETRDNSHMHARHDISSGTFVQGRVRTKKLQLACILWRVKAWKEPCTASILRPVLLDLPLREQSKTNIVRSFLVARVLLLSMKFTDLGMSTLLSICSLLNSFTIYIGVDTEGLPWSNRNALTWELKNSIAKLSSSTAPTVQQPIALLELLLYRTRIKLWVQNGDLPTTDGVSNLYRSTLSSSTVRRDNRGITGAL